MRMGNTNVVWEEEETPLRNSWRPDRDGVTVISGVEDLSPPSSRWKCKRALQPASAGFLLGLLFHLEDGGVMFLRIVGHFLNCAASQRKSPYSLYLIWAELYVTTDGQPASLSWNKAPIWGLRPDLYYLGESYGLVLVGLPLWREDGSVFYICCWPLPAQSFFGLSPLGLTIIFYCLTFETSLFVASYDSQGHGGGIRSRLHTGIYI
jgi:hypothetical protein